MSSQSTARCLPAAPIPALPPLAGDADSDAF